MSDFPKHSMNSLCSDSISYFVTCTAEALQDSMMLQKNLHPLKTSSCGNRLAASLAKNVFENLFSGTWSTKCGNELCSLAIEETQECFREIKK